MMLRSFVLLLVTAAATSLTAFSFAPAFTSSRRAVTELGAAASPDRRAFLNCAAVAAAVTASQILGGDPAQASAAAPSSDKVLVLGGTGLVGSRVVQKLKSTGVDVIATSTDGRDGTTRLDFTDTANVALQIENLAKGCTAVISTVGVIGTDKDATINAGSGLAAGAAKQAGSVRKFVYISVAPEVKELAKGIDFLEDYMTGKQFSEESIVSYFGSNGFLIEPTFIYGGDKFGVTPPRVTTTYGKIIEGLLSSGPLRAIANVAPEGFIKIALEPPVAADAVASAAVASALGKSTVTTLDTYDKIQAAASIVL